MATEIGKGEEEIVAAPKPTTTQSGRVELLRTCFTGVQAGSAITLASLAVYGVFFTSIPETIVRQLRADVADAREELAGLRGERNRLAAQIDSLKADLQGATSRREEAEKNLAKTTANLATNNSELEATQGRLRDERAEIARLQQETESLRADATNAQAHLREVEQKIAGLSAERQKYSRIALGRDFLAARTLLDAKLRKYAEAADYAEYYLIAPTMEAEDAAWKKRMEGKSPSEQLAITIEWRQWLDDQLKNPGVLAALRRKWTDFKSITDENNSDRTPEMPHGTVAAATFLLDQTVLLPRLTGRALVSEAFAKPNSLTPEDFRAFRQILDSAMQSAPALNAQVLVNRELIVGRGKLAENEIERARVAIRSTEAFLTAVQSKFQP